MRKFSKIFATVFTENKCHQVMLPSGEVLPHLVESITTDGIERSKVTITMVCNIVATREDAIKEYSKIE